MNGTRLRRILQIGALILSVFVILGLLRSLRRDGPAALTAWRAADVRWLWISAAVGLGLLGHALNVIGWRRLIRDCGVPITMWLTARLFILSNLGRYLPGGKAWQMGIVGVMAAENGLPAATVTATSLFQGLVGVVVGALLFVMTGGAALGVAPGWLALPLGGVAALVATPAIIARLPRVRDVVVARLPSVATVTPMTMWTLVWTAALSWLVWGVGLYCLALGLLPDAAASLVVYIAAWIGPMLAGIIAFVAPAGIGVRDELMKTLLVTAGVTASNAVMIMVIGRMWITALEVLPAVILLAVRGRARSPEVAM